MSTHEYEGAALANNPGKALIDFVYEIDRMGGGLPAPDWTVAEWAAFCSGYQKAQSYILQCQFHGLTRAQAEQILTDAMAEAEGVPNTDAFALASSKVKAAGWFRDTNVKVGTAESFPAW